MSKWYDVKNQEDVELSEDGKTLEIYIGSDEWGNVYADVPIEFVENVLKNKKRSER